MQITHGQDAHPLPSPSTRFYPVLFHVCRRSPFRAGEDFPAAGRKLESISRCPARTTEVTMLRLCSLALMLLAGTVCASVRAAEPTVLVWKMAGLPAASIPTGGVLARGPVGAPARRRALCPRALDPKQLCCRTAGVSAPARAALLSYLRGGGAALAGRTGSHEPLLPSPRGGCRRRGCRSREPARRW